MMATVSAALVLTMASTPLAHPAQAPPRPRRPTARLHSPAAWADQAQRGPSKVGAQQSAALLLALVRLSAVHARALARSPRKPQAIAKEGLEKGRVPRICADGRALVPWQEAKAKLACKVLGVGRASKCGDRA